MDFSSFSRDHLWKRHRSSSGPYKTDGILLPGKESLLCAALCSLPQNPLIVNFNLRFICKTFYYCKNYSMFNKQKGNEK